MKKLLLEYSFQKLYNNTTQGFEAPRRDTSHRVQVTTTAFIPSTANNSLEVRAKTKTDHSNYDSIVYLQDIQYSDESDNTAIAIKATDNSDYYIVPVDKNVDVQVNCTCLDFHYKFAVWNDAQGALFGDAPPMYVKKTDRAPYNPRKLPGLCKHLMKMFDYLHQEKIIR